MFKQTISSLLTHKLRLGATAIAVVLGVALVVGTFVLTDTLNHTFDNLFTTAAKGIDVQVRSRAAFEATQGNATDREPVQASLLRTVRAIDGVRFADGEVGGYAQIVDKKGKAIAPQGPPTIGTNYPSHPELTALSIRQGRRPQGPDEVAIDATTAKKHGFKVGDQVKILLIGPARTFKLSGIMGFGDADNLVGATMAAFDTPTAQRVLNEVGRFDAIDVAAAPGVSPSALRSRIAQSLPGDLVAVLVS